MGEEVHRPVGPHTACPRATGPPTAPDDAAAADGSADDSSGDLDGNAAPGDPLTEITAEAEIMVGHIFPGAGMEYAEAISVVGTTLNYLAGDSSRPEPEVDETIVLTPDQAEELRAQLVDLSLPQMEGVPTGPDAGTGAAGTHFWVVSEEPNGVSLSWSVGDRELDRAVWEAVVVHVPDDIRAS